MYQVFVHITFCPFVLVCMHYLFVYFSILDFDYLFFIAEIIFYLRVNETNGIQITALKIFQSDSEFP